MSGSTYLSKNLGQNQLRFNAFLNDYEIDIFSLKDIKGMTEGVFNNVEELVENLQHKKILSRIERGKYCKSNFRDEKVIGCSLVPDGTIGYWSALHQHGFTDQFPNSIFIQTTKQKKEKSVFGVNYKFIKIAPFKINGVVKEGIGNHVYQITNLEKTIVDCFDLPQYSGGYAELIRAFSLAKLDNEHLINACKAIDNLAVTKRLGYLAEFFNKKELIPFIEFAYSSVNEKYNLFDPFGVNNGKFIKKWKIRLNISADPIARQTFSL